MNGGRAANGLVGAGAGAGAGPGRICGGTLRVLAVIALIIVSGRIVQVEGRHVALSCAPTFRFRGGEAAGRCAAC